MKTLRIVTLPLKVCLIYAMIGKDETDVDYITNDEKKIISYLLRIKPCMSSMTDDKKNQNEGIHPLFRT